MAKGIKVTLDDRKLNNQITNALKAAPAEALKAMNECVLDLAGESARRAPIESGDLQNNCHGTIQGMTVFENMHNIPAFVPPAAKIEGRVGYSLPYAVRQHEDLALRHDRTDGYRIETGENAGKTVNLTAGGEAKFLEKPFNERKERYIRRFERVVEDSIK